MDESQSPWLLGVVTDLDGTLLGARGALSAKTISVVNRLMERHVPFVAATARPVNSALEVLRSLHRIPPIVASNGSVFYDPAEGRIVRPGVLKRTVVERLLRCLATAGRFLVKIDYSSGVSDLYEIPEMEAALRSAKFGSVSIVAVRARSEGSDRELRTISNSLEGASTTSSESGLIEIMPPALSKAATLEWIVEWKWKLSLKSFVAFGDQLNDIEMLTACGYSVAPSNAAPQVLALVDYITVSNEEDGVALALDSMNLGASLF